MNELLNHVYELIRLNKGDLGRLEHIKNTLENNRTLYISDRKYVEDLISKYISNKEIFDTSNPNDEEKESHGSSQDTINYNRKSVSNLPKSISQISLVVGIGIAIIVVFLSLHVYAISNLEFRNYQSDEPDFTDMSMDMQFEACNPTFFPVTLKQFNVEVIYKTTNFATLTIDDNNIPPHSSTIVNGRFKVNSEALVGFFLSALKSAFSDEKMSPPDPKDLKYIAKFDVPILGVIPFSITKEFSNSEFQNLMSNNQGDFHC